MFHKAEHLDRVDTLLSNLHAQGSFSMEEVWHQRKDGTEFLALMSATLVRNFEGAPLYVAATCVDISERAWNQRRLNMQNSVLAALAEDRELPEVLDLRGFNLNAKLDIDPEFLKEDEAEGAEGAHSHHDHGHDHHDHVHGEHCNHPSHQHGHGHHHHHDDDVKSFVYRSDRPFDPAKLEDFLGAIVNIYGPRMLRYKGVLNMKGTERKVIFQGVHQLMGSDLGPKWMPGEKKMNKMVFIGIDLPKDILLHGLEGCLV